MPVPLPAAGEPLAVPLQEGLAPPPPVAGGSGEGDGGAPVAMPRTGVGGANPRLGAEALCEGEAYAL